MRYGLSYNPLLWNCSVQHRKMLLRTNQLKLFQFTVVTAESSKVRVSDTQSVLQKKREKGLIKMI
jgi:hypothetical protein